MKISFLENGIDSLQSGFKHLNEYEKKTLQKKKALKEQYA